MKDEINIVDAGARYGIHPNIASMKCKRHIFAFEPEETEFEYLKRKYISDKTYHLFRLALSNKKSMVELNIPTHKGCATLSAINDASMFFSELRKSEGSIKEIQSVQGDTIDNLISEKVIDRPDLIKADVEGHEIQLLEGSSDALKTCLSVNIEMIFDNTYFKQTASKIIEILIDDFDFILLGFDYDGKGMPIHSLGHSMRKNNEGKGIVTGINGFFTKRESFFHGIDDLQERQYNVLKSSIIAFCYGYDDFAFHLVDRYLPSSFLSPKSDIRFPSLQNFLKFHILKAIYRSKTENLLLFDTGKEFFEEKFGESYPDKHKYFRYLDELVENR